MKPREDLDLSLPSFGFGGASVGNLFAASSDSEAEEAMATAMAVGFDYFDTAPHYGHGLSEVRIGRFLAGLSEHRPVLSTKVGRVLKPSGPVGPPDHGFVNPLPFTQVFDYSYDGVMRSFDDSCARLGVENVDILFMHDIGRLTHGDAHDELFAQAMDGGYRAMDELKRAGKTKAIGLGVNEWEVCAQTFACADFDIFMLAGRYTLMEQEPLHRLFPECARRGVGVICAGPFNSGLLARRPDAASHYNYTKAPRDIIERATRLYEFCERQGVPVQAAALQFPLRHRVVRSVVGGMSSAARVRSTAAWARFPIPDGFWDEIRSAGLVDPAVPTR
ncbi:MAG: aldo/keto reductase [Parvularculaceae bacterium]|nr:aldo/keto reductase [Parvularculaceae bacterium]